MAVGRITVVNSVGEEASFLICSFAAPIEDFVCMEVLFSDRVFDAIFGLRRGFYYS